MSYHSRLILLVIIVALNSCGEQKNKQSIDLTTSIVAGRVINQDYYSHIKTIDLTIPDFPGNIIVHTCPIEEDGSFKLEIQPLIPRDISLYPLLNHILINPGDSIFLEIDFSNIRDTQFSGNGADINNHIREYFKESFVSFHDEGYDLLPKEYKHFCDSVRNLNIDRRDSFSDINNTSKLFKEWTQRCIEVNYYIKMIDYPLRHSYRNSTEWLFPKEYYSYIQDLEDIYESPPLYSGVFTLVEKFLKSYYKPKNLKEFLGSGLSTDSILIEKILFEYSDEKLNQYLLSTFFHSYFNVNTLDIYTKYKEVYTNNITDPFLKLSLETNLNKTKDYLENPHKISNAILNGNEFEEQEILQISGDRNIADSIISKNKGKLVFAYFWATWCPACHIDAPYFNAAMEKYKDDNIEFVYICINESPNRDSIITSLFNKGTHYRCSESESKTVMKKFSIFSSIPYSLLIDKEGNIVDYGSHVRPQNKLTISRIEELLKQE